MILQRTEELHMMNQWQCQLFRLMASTYFWSRSRSHFSQLESFPWLQHEPLLLNYLKLMKCETEKLLLLTIPNPDLLRIIVN